MVGCPIVEARVVDDLDNVMDNAAAVGPSRANPYAPSRNVGLQVEIDFNNIVTLTNVSYCIGLLAGRATLIQLPTVIA